MSDTPHSPTEALVDFALGTLDSQARRETEVHLQTCVGCRQELAELQAALEGFANVTKPPPMTYERLSKSIEGGARFAHLLEPLASLFDLSLDEARALANRIDDPTAWQPGFGEGMWLMPVTPGPAFKEDITSMLKLEPGCTFPNHEHGGDEQVLVLEGAYRDEKGREFWRGEFDVNGVGTSHEMVALPHLPCICASRLKGVA